MECGGRCDGSARSKMNKIKFHQEEVTRLSNELVDDEMINGVSAEFEKCEDLLCTVCPYLYDKDIIVNKNDIFKYYVNKRLNCKGFKEGIYSIICTKPDCDKRGVVYWGESENVRLRLHDHIQKISGDGNVRTLHVHDHFKEHGGNDKLEYLKCALVQEVLEYEEVVVEVDENTGEEKEVKAVWKGELARRSKCI